METEGKFWSFVTYKDYRLTHITCPMISFGKPCCLFFKIKKCTQRNIRWGTFPWPTISSSFQYLTHSLHRSVRHSWSITYTFDLDLWLNPFPTTRFTVLALPSSWRSPWPTSPSPCSSTLSSSSGWWVPSLRTSKSHGFSSCSSQTYQRCAANYSIKVISISDTFPPLLSSLFLSHFLSSSLLRSLVTFTW